MDFGYSEVVSTLALALSIYSMYKSNKFNEHQKEVNENQDALNKRLLAKEEGEILKSKKADIGARIIKLSQGKYKLKVFNSGANAAKNVRLEFPDGDELGASSSMADKFPYEILEPRDGTELWVSSCLGTRSKHKVLVKWEDDFSKSNEKIIYVSF
ncbi:hypothetical protein [Vibrio quintilis]|uniref:hypothetical protein n=1 Tax=Vibrio quintilis TaxID=1117707 RepID=UPI0021C994C8|nr:hypothetical protein [Vibrio quintilis]